mmetsp:Transcript_24443/g.53336  ORF Transcript_24443/g.53336 Transcript_24443/m.53336 type:complete len:89 (-) Transcript_24443:437-703(-)
MSANGLSARFGINGIKLSARRNLGAGRFFCPVDARQHTTSALEGDFYVRCSCGRMPFESRGVMIPTRFVCVHVQRARVMPPRCGADSR